MAYSRVHGRAENLLPNETDRTTQWADDFPRATVVRKPLPSRSIPLPALQEWSSPLFSPLPGEEAVTPPVNEAPSSRDSSTLKVLGGSSSVTRHMSGGHLQILLAFFATSLPIVILAAVLLGLIYANRLPNAVSLNHDVSVHNTETCKHGLFVNFPATRLTFVSSLISSAATYMSLPIMTLASFPISRGLINDSKRCSQTVLPSPYQSNLLISLLAGGLNSLWNTIEYLIFWRKKRVQMYKAVATCASILGVMVALSLLCQLADIWFHNATSSEVYTSTTPSNAEIKYGRQLSAGCVQYYKKYIYTEGAVGSQQTGFNTSRIPCNIIVGDLTFSSTNLSEGYQLASTSTSSSSQISLISNVSVGQNTSAFAVLLPSGAPPNAAWQANTVGVSSHCQAISNECHRSCPTSKDCGLDEAQVGDSLALLYNCSESTVPSNVYGNPFAGTIKQSTIVIQALKSDQWNLPNPYIAAVAGAISAASQSDKPIFGSPEVLNSGDFPAVVLMCTTSVWDILYRSVEGTIIIDQANLSNLNTSQTVSGPLINTADSLGALPLISISNSLSNSVVVSQTVDEFLSKFASAYSQVTLAYAAGAFDAISGNSFMTTSTKIVSCVPMAPLWSLIALAGIYFLLGVCFTIVALSTLSSENVRSVQAQLSIAGLTAAGFEERPSSRPDQKVERVEELFKEYHQGHDGSVEKDWTVEGVGFTRNAGGHWEFSMQRTA